ncbi:MAG: glycosyltransferase [Oscillospiraceae bacterium]
MNLLILSGNTGEGHNSCAQAVREACLARGGRCRVEDALQFVSPGFSRFIAGWHIRIYCYAPGLFRLGYTFMENHPARDGSVSPLRRLLSRGTENLRDFIREGGYDAVLSTHPFGALMLTNIRETCPLPVTTGFVATDYTCSPSVRENSPDLCFIPHGELAGEFVCENLPREKLVDTGIPVRAMFGRAAGREEAKRLLGLPAACPHLLVMCGSMGCGPMRELVARLARELDADKRVTVVCGTNEKLRRRLEQRWGGDGRFRILGYVEEMSQLMDSADLCLTKPGGVSTSEAARKGLPMVLVNAVSGCETYNSRFFVSRGAAVTAGSGAELAALCAGLLGDEAERRRMETALAALSRPRAAEEICAALEERTAPGRSPAEVGG